MTFETGRPGVFGTGDVRIGAATVVQAIAEGRRAAYAVDAYLKGQDLAAIRTRQTLAEPQPEFLSIVPFTGEIKEPRYRLKALEAEARNDNYVEYEIPYTPRRGGRRVHPLPAVHLRGDRLLRPATAGDRVRHDAQDARAAATTRAPATGRVTENRFTGVNHDYLRDDSHAFILREPARCIDCGRCANVCAEVVGAACYDFMRIGFDTLVTTPLDMSLNDTPCVSCGRCAETCPTGALMPKPRVLQKYDVDESRCILCGICVDACPYDAVRDSDQFELSHTSPRGADDRPPRARRGRARDRDELHPPRARLGRAGPGRGPLPRADPPAPRPARLDRVGARAGNGHGDGNGHGYPEPGTRTGRPAATDAEPPGREALREGRVTLPETIPIARDRAGTTCCSWSWPAAMIGSALLVVTMRDIIRCGLAMIVELRRAGRAVRAARRAARRGRPGARLHRRDQRPHPVRDHAHPDARSARPRLVFQTQAVPAAIARSCWHPALAVAVAVTDWPTAGGHDEAVDRTRGPRACRCSTHYVLPFEIVSVLLLAAVIGGVFLAKRERGGGRLMLASST